MEPGKPAYEKIVAAFGKSILLPDGALDRPAMRKLVFDDEAKRRLLMGAIGGAIRKELFMRLLRHWCMGSKVVVVDAPTLYETKMQRICAQVVVVAADSEVQLRRVVKRDGSSEEDARKIIAAQLPMSEKVERADRVLWNDGTLEEARAKAQALADSLQSAYGGLSLMLSGPGVLALLGGLTLLYSRL